MESISSSEVSTFLQERFTKARPFSKPLNVSDEMIRGAGYFEEIEIWGKREIRKDPIAVGITQDRESVISCAVGEWIS